MPALDASAVFDPATGVASVFLVNRDARPQATTLSFADRTVGAVREATLVADDDPKAANTWDAPERVTPTKGKATVDNGRVRVEVPAYGFLAITIETKPR